MGDLKTLNEIQQLFVQNTREYVQYLQSYDSYDSMIYTSVCWGILNKQISCVPKEKYIVVDARRWVYITRLCLYLYAQEFYASKGMSSERGVSYKLSSIERTIKNSFSRTWCLSFDPTLRIFRLTSDIDFSDLTYRDNTLNRLDRQYKWALSITKSFIDYFKELSPAKVIEHWSLSFAYDTVHADNRESYLEHKKLQSWRDDFIL